MVGCGGSTTDTGSTTEPTEEWTTLIEFNGTFANGETEAISDVFETTASELRITYSQTTTSAGGNSMIYILPEGWTKTTNANGDLDVAVQDISAMGDKDNEQKTVEKEPGRYYIDINTSGVDTYNIKVEQKK